MKKQTVLWTAVLLLATWVARGQTTYPMSLVVEGQAPAEREVVELSKISKVTFSEGKMLLSLQKIMRSSPREAYSLLKGSPSVYFLQSMLLRAFSLLW